MSVTLNGGAPVLLPPERNNFFYGMLLDVEACQKDQHHADFKRSLLNRIALGSGVACGLRMRPSPNTPALVRLDPGVAIDGWGREIVVSEAVTFDPHRLTDAQGTPVGDPLAAGAVAVFLAYGEQKQDLRPAPAGGSDPAEACAPATICERYRILLRSPPPSAPPVTPPSPLPLDDPPALHALLTDRVGAAWSTAPADPAVPLGLVTLDDGTIDNATGRPLLYGQALLWDVVVALAAEVAALKGAP